MLCLCCLLGGQGGTSNSIEVCSSSVANFALHCQLYLTLGSPQKLDRVLLSYGFNSYRLRVNKLELELELVRQADIDTDAWGQAHCASLTKPSPDRQKA